MKITKIFSLTLLIVLMSGCSKDFLSRYPTTSLANDIALTTIENCESAAVGLYAAMGSSSYIGRNLTVWGDLATDNASTKGADAGHLWNLEGYQITTSLDEVESLWSTSYTIIARATRVLNGSKELLAKTSIATDKDRLEVVIAQCYAVRAYATFVLANYFCLPYPTTATGPNTAKAQTMNGVVVITTDATPINTPVKQTNLEATYQAVLTDLQASKDAFDRARKTTSQTTDPQYFISKAAVAALQARVNLFMGNWDEAKTRAEEAITLRNGNLEYNFEKYLTMWETPVITTEDIFTINKNSKTQLSANSINNFYISYGGNFEPIKSLFTFTDMRKQLYAQREAGKSQSKCQKYPNAFGLNNIPVIRLPEMHLTLAEAHYRLGNATAAAEELLKIAKRDTAVTTITETGEDLFERIKVERRKETAGEGLRWMDMRRWGTPIVRTSDVLFRFPFKDPYAVKDFAYPIPDGERNANHLMDQNEVWDMSKNGGSVNLPTLKSDE